MSKHIFISYSKKDYDYAHALADYIRRQGFDVWIDGRLRVGDDWVDRIFQAIDNSAAIIVLMSPNSKDSVWVKREALDAEEKGIPVIPLLLAGEKFRYLGNLQYFDVRKGQMPDGDFWLKLASIVPPKPGDGHSVAPPEPVASKIPPFRMRWIAVGFGVLLLVTIIIFALINNGNDDPDQEGAVTNPTQPHTIQPTLTETATEQPSLTPSSEPTQTDTPTEEPFKTPISTLEPSETATSAPETSFSPETFEGNAASVDTPAFDVEETATPKMSLLGLSSVEPVTANEQWTPVIREFDGVEMVLVPIGCFMMGDDLSIYLDERPAHEKCINFPFWLDRTEVIRSHYNSCSDAGACDFIRINEYSYLNHHPINFVNWIQAEEFCRWRGQSLPSEPQWEYAARGPSSWQYPWGNTFYDYAVYSRNSMNEAQTVGTYPEGASWVGALDMSGNVWEWTNDAMTGYGGDRRLCGGRSNTSCVIRGGAFNRSSVYLRAAFRLYYNPVLEYNYFIGFRCARDFSPEDLSQ